MGNKASRAALKDKEVKRYCDKSSFTADEVRALYGQFLSLKGVESAGAGDDLTMNLGEFQFALGYKGGADKSVFIERVFKLFDSNHDGLINFEEFVVGLSLLTPNAVPEKKLQFTFAIYDLDNKNKISPSNLRYMLTEALKENVVPLTDPQIDKMVTDTFNQHDVNHDGFIDFDEYQQMCVKFPAILKPLTLNVSELIAQAKDDGVSHAHGGGAAGSR